MNVTEAIVIIFFFGAMVAGPTGMMYLFFNAFKD